MSTASSLVSFANLGAVAVPCPALSAGSGGSGCTCLAGCSGTITPVVGSPYYTGSCAGTTFFFLISFGLCPACASYMCTAVSCPTHSSGANVPSGCVCLPGFAGAVSATTVTPFWTSSCAPVPCPAHTLNSDRPDCGSGAFALVHEQFFTSVPSHFRLQQVFFRA